MWIEIQREPELENYYKLTLKPFNLTNAGGQHQSDVEFQLLGLYIYLLFSKQWNQLPHLNTESSHLIRLLSCSSAQARKKTISMIPVMFDSTLIGGDMPPFSSARSSLFWFFCLTYDTKSLNIWHTNDNVNCTFSSCGKAWMEERGWRRKS